MRNLKRALSLALAAMMLIGMMVVGASAASKDFTDKDEIKNTEAVNTMVALNVISGKEDGSYFDPTGTLTRAEMAKIISYVMNGGVEPNLGTKVVPTYSDIDNHWAEAYIEYCTSMGIIVGDGTGKFNPEGTLTASQCAKMFLTAMGYKAEVFGFTGNSWETNTNRYANEAGLYEGLGGLSVSAPISRDDACQMAYNAIQSPLMVRGWSQNQQTGQVTETYNLAVNEQGEAIRSLLSERFGGKIFVGTFVGNTSTKEYAKDGYVKIDGNLTTDDPDAPVKPAWIPYDLDIAGIGEEYKVIYKEGNGGKDGQPDDKDTIYGVFNTGATDVITATQADVKDQKSDKAQINIGGDKYDTEDSVTVVTNYVGEGTPKSATNGTDAGDGDNSDLTKALKAANGNTIKAVTNPDTGKISIVYITTSKIAAVTAVNSEKVSMNNGVGTLVIADNEIYDGIAKGDVVVVTTLYNTDNTADNALTIVEKAEVVSGTVNGYKTVTTPSTAYENVTVDGTVYNIYNKDVLLNAIPGETVTTTFDDEDIGETFDLYLVNGFVGAAIQTSESANNYSLVTDVTDGCVAGDAFSPLKLQVVDAEGTTTVITVSKDSKDTNEDKVIDFKDYTKGDIIVYTGDSSDAVVTVKGEMASSSKSYNENTKAFDGKVTTADCVLFAETTDKALGATGAKYKVYEIRSLDGFTATNTTTVTNSDGKVVAVFADLGSTPAGATSTTVYGIVTSYNGTVKIDSVAYYQYTVASNDETYTVNMNTNEKIAKGNLVSFDPVGDSIYAADDLTVVSGTAVYVKEYSEADGTLTYFTSKSGSEGQWTGETQKTLALDEDCVIVYVDADGDAAGSDIGVNGFDSVTGYKNAAIVTKSVDDENVIVAIFVETSNKCDIL